MRCIYPILIVLAGYWLQVGCARQHEHRPIEYEVVRTWQGGKGKDIVIAEQRANWNDLELLGNQLHRETRGMRWAMIVVFTSKRAASMRESAGHLSASDGKYYDAHSVAEYRMDPKDGSVEYFWSPSGLTNEFRTKAF